MNRIQVTVNKVLDRLKLQIAPSTYKVRKNYLVRLASHAESIGIAEPCQELFDSYVARASTPDLRFQLLHAVRLVDKETGSKAFTPEGKLYNEPEFPPPDESEKIFQSISFPIADGTIDTGHLVYRAESEMDGRPIPRNAIPYDLFPGTSRLSLLQMTSFPLSPGIQ